MEIDEKKLIENWKEFLDNLKTMRESQILDVLKPAIGELELHCAMFVATDGTILNSANVNPDKRTLAHNDILIYPFNKEFKCGMQSVRDIWERSSDELASEIWKAGMSVQDSLQIDHKWLRLNSGTIMDKGKAYLELPPQLSYSQHQVLSDFLYMIYEDKQDTVAVYCIIEDKVEPQIYSFEKYDPEYIMDRIDEFYRTGKLLEAKQQYTTLQEAVSANPLPDTQQILLDRFSRLKPLIDYFSYRGQNLYRRMYNRLQYILQRTNQSLESPIIELQSHDSTIPLPGLSWIDINRFIPNNYVNTVTAAGVPDTYVLNLTETPSLTIHFCPATIYYRTSDKASIQLDSAISKFFIDNNYALDLVHAQALARLADTGYHQIASAATSGANRVIGVTSKKSSTIQSAVAEFEFAVRLNLTDSLTSKISPPTISRSISLEASPTNHATITASTVADFKAQIEDVKRVVEQLVAEKQIILQELDNTYKVLQNGGTQILYLEDITP